MSFFDCFLRYFDSGFEVNRSNNLAAWVLTKKREGMSKVFPPFFNSLAKSITKASSKL
jgi:hypothetical protein